MKSTVLLSVYNGIKYLGQQLESIKNQKKLPEEVIIIDDCSTDNSSEYVSDYIKINNLSANWRLIVNSENKGWKRNFMEGIDYSTGDIVFFSDQDDIWFPDKIEVYNEIFKDNSIDVLISPYIEYYGKEISLPKMTSNYYKISMDGDFKNYNITGLGCTLAFRKKYYKKIKDYYVEGWAHDDFFRKMPQLEGRLGVLESPSIFRRIHNNNYSLKRRTYYLSYSNFEVYIKSIDNMIKYVNDIGIEDIEEKNIKFLFSLKKGYENRLKYYDTGNIKYLIKTVLLNKEQYSRIRQIPGDIVLVTKHFLSNKDD